MAIKNLLVAYNGTESSDAALQSALYLREKYDAHLTGLLAYGVTNSHQAANAWIPLHVKELLEEAKKEAARQVREKFTGLTEAAGAADKIHWIAEVGQADATVAKYARLFDLTILGRYDAVLDEDQSVLHPDAITMISGRPVLLVPREFDMSTVSEHAVVAWDGKRASARALGDAMQMLETESLVTVVTVADGVSEANLPGMDIETMLKRHDINTKIVKLEKNGHSIGKTILGYLDETQPKLLVMGAYEHSKFRQSIVGGVTNNVLKKAKMPILISH